MSTRSLIAMENSGGTVSSIYCHFDGYIAGVGKTLQEHYTEREVVKQLIALGSISSLGERLVPIGSHSFEDQEEGTTVAYHRDRGEEWKGTKPSIPAYKERVLNRFSLLFCA